MTLPCDGCRDDLDPRQLTFVDAEGTQARYCVLCLPRYRDFVTACAGEEARLNQTLSAAIRAQRDQCTLRFVPQDLPGRRGIPNG